MQPAVHTEGLTKKFGRTKAVMDLDLLIEPGECFALVGRQDAGKSTILHLLLNLVHPSAGRARVGGYDTTKGAYHVHRVVGYVPAKLVPPQGLTVNQWLDRARSFRRSEIDGSIRHRVVPALDASLDDDLAGLSQSELSVIALIAALQKSPELLMLDEAVLGMRAHHDVLLELLGDYRSTGGTILMTSRELDVSGDLCERVGLLDSGTLVATGTLDELRDRGRKRLEFVFEREQHEDLFSTTPAVLGAVVQGKVARVLVHGHIDPVVEHARRNGATEFINHEAGLDELVSDLRELDIAS